MFGSSANDRHAAPTGVGTKFIFTLFGLIFLGGGLLLAWCILLYAAKGLQTWTWRKTACEIISSNIRQQDQDGERPGYFNFEVKYRYTYGGEKISSEQYKRTPESTDNYSKVARLAEHYPPGASAVCYVNPSAPAQAVLARYNLFSLFLFLFPMPFVAVGGGVIYSAWRSKSARQWAAQPISDRAAPSWAAPRQGRWIAVAIFLFCLLVGGAAFYLGFFLPAYKVQCAKAWPAVPCVVISSEVKSDGSGKGTTYTINIFYSYEFEGRVLKSNSYGFMGGSSTDYYGKQAVVARNPPGTRTVCYVNPDEPTEAVLVRGITSVTSEMWFSLIVSLPFLVIGVGGLVPMVITRCRSGSVGGVRPGSEALPAGSAASGPAFSASGVAERLVLKPPIALWGMFIGAVLLCLFWNGIVSVFVIEAVNRWRAGHPAWGMMLFLIPFVAIGLVIAGFLLYQFLVLFNPRPQLAVTPGAVPLGGTLQVQWNLTGRVGVLQDLHLRLEGREDATFSGGKGSSTEKSVFAKLEIADVTTPREMRSGEARVTIPARLVPSFAGAHNKIIWAIHVHGKIARWPDVKMEFPVTVLPSAPTTRPSL